MTILPDLSSVVQVGPKSEGYRPVREDSDEKVSAFDTCIELPYSNTAVYQSIRVFAERTFQFALVCSTNTWYDTCSGRTLTPCVRH